MRRERLEAKVKFPALSMNWECLEVVACLDTEMEEHSFRFPACKEQDGFGTNISTEEGGGTAGAE